MFTAQVSRTYVLKNSQGLFEICTSGNI